MDFFSMRGGKEVTNTVAGNLKNMFNFNWKHSFWKRGFLWTKVIKIGEVHLSFIWHLRLENYVLGPFFTFS